MLNRAKTVGEIVRKQKNTYTQEYTNISSYVRFSQYHTIEKIEAYLNSKHISGEYDSLGREKPFFNIVNGVVNIWMRSTDLDRKDVRMTATKDKDQMGALLLNLHLQDWMKKSNFGSFLNDWGRTLARYGSAVVKFVEQDGDLKISVTPWNRIISDTVNFEDNVVIEQLEMTEAQLRQHAGYDQDAVDELVNALTARENLNRQNKDNKADYIRLYEVHGNLSLATLKMAQGKEPNDGDDLTYVPQMHVVSFVGQKKDKKAFDDFTLYSGREARSPYMITHLIKEDGRALSIGAVEHLFQAQWMNNHTQKLIKDQLDMASMVLFQTADGNFTGMNALSAMQDGDILVYNQSPITQVQNNSHDISNIQNWQNQWQEAAKDITSTPDAISGATQPSGTAYRQVAILNQEANSLFELMTENKGLHIEEMCRAFIIPYLMKQMKTSKQVVATLDASGIKQIEDTYVRNEAIKRNKQMVKEMLLGKRPVSQPNQPAMEQQVRDELSQSGEVRYVSPDTVGTKTWKTLFSDLEWDVEVETTNEQSDKNANLITLNTLFTTIASLNGQPMSPEAQFVFNKILSETGTVSPVELAQFQQPQQSQQSQAAQKPPIETIDFKDLPPDGQVQLAAQAGIQIQTPQPQPVAPAPTP